MSGFWRWFWPVGWLTIMVVFCGALAVWSPDHEPWWWRLLFVLFVALIAFLQGQRHPMRESAGDDTA